MDTTRRSDMMEKQMETEIEICDECGGTGQTPVEPCEWCGGNGHILLVLESNITAVKVDATCPNCGPTNGAHLPDCPNSQADGGSEHGKF